MRSPAKSHAAATAATLLALAALPSCASSPETQQKAGEALVRPLEVSEEMNARALAETRAVRAIIDVVRSSNYPLKTSHEIAVEVDPGATASYAAFVGAMAYGRNAHPRLVLGKPSELAAASTEGDQRATTSVTNIAMIVGRDKDGSMTVLLYNPLREDKGGPAIFDSRTLDAAGGLTPPETALDALAKHVGQIWSVARETANADLKAIPAPEAR